MIHIDYFNLEQHAKKMRSIKYEWEQNPLKKCDVNTIGATAGSLKRLNASFDEVYNKLLLLAEETAKFLESVSDTSKNVDDSIAKAFRK